MSAVVQRNTRRVRECIIGINAAPSASLHRGEPHTCEVSTLAMLTFAGGPVGSGGGGGAAGCGDAVCCSPVAAAGWAPPGMNAFAAPPAPSPEAPKADGLGGAALGTNAVGAGACAQAQHMWMGCHVHSLVLIYRSALTLPNAQCRPGQLVHWLLRHSTCCGTKRRTDANLCNAVNGVATLGHHTDVRRPSRCGSNGRCSRALWPATWPHTVYEFARSPACAGGAEVARDGTNTAGCCGGGPTCAGCSYPPYCPLIALHARIKLLSDWSGRGVTNKRSVTSRHQQSPQREFECCGDSPDARVASSPVRGFHGRQEGMIERRFQRGDGTCTSSRLAAVLGAAQRSAGTQPAAAAVAGAVWEAVGAAAAPERCRLS